MNNKPLPGSFGLSKVRGAGGFLINWGQILVGDKSGFGHAFMVLDNDEVLEAMPSGARIVPLKNYLDRQSGDVVFCDAPVRNLFQPSALEAETRARVCRSARALVGTEYGYLNYLVLGLIRFGIRPQWLVNRMQDNRRIICSQTVDIAFTSAGVEVFDDGRLPFEVTPGDLDRYRIANEVWAPSYISDRRSRVYSKVNDG